MDAPCPANLDGSHAIKISRQQLALWLGIKEFNIVRFPPKASGMRPSDWQVDDRNPDTGRGKFTLSKHEQPERG